MKTFNDFNIDVGNKSTGKMKTQCPECSATRTNKRDKCLSVDIDQGSFNCNNCGFSGTTKFQKKPKYIKPKKTKENIYDKNYRLDLIEGIKNPRLKKLYQKWGINDTTYLLGQYMSDVLGDDGVFYNRYRDCFEQEKHKKKMLEDFDFFTKAENMKDFFNALQIKELKKYAHFVF